MKRFIAMAICFALAACAMVGCRRTEDMKTTVPTTTHPTITTHTTNSVAPTTENSLPTSSSENQNTSETSSMPTDNDNAAGENGNKESSRARTHFPTVIDGNR